LRLAATISFAQPCLEPSVYQFTGGNGAGSLGAGATLSGFVLCCSNALTNTDVS
jgi:hypothetical protein